MSELKSNFLDTLSLPPEMELTRKLEGIFMPEARKIRDAFYTNSRRFVHYTSAEAALKIIKTKRLWMRNTTCMADYKEVEHGFEMFRSFFSTEEKRRAFTDALDICAPGAAMEAINLFNQWWEQLRFNTYVSSIAEHENSEDTNGRLSMWRAFGGTSGRIALVFEVPFFSDSTDQLGIIFSPVVYQNQDKVHATIHTTIERIRRDIDLLRTLDKEKIVWWVFFLLMIGVLCSKHEGFLEEREWRAIYTPKRASSPLMVSSTEVINGIPQIVYHMPLDKSVSPALEPIDLATMFDRLIIGPSSYPWAMYEAFVDALTGAGITDASKRVQVSEIPIRA